MIIQIIKAKESCAWYASHIGEHFEVKPFDNIGYELVPDDGRWIRKEDTIEIKRHKAVNLRRINGID
jgi:hypothetical protein